MKALFVLRHAKSSWENTDLSDFARPLNERGLKAAPLMGKFIYKNQLQPELILSSLAERAKQTALLVKKNAQIGGEIRYDERIYEATPKRLLEVLAEQSDKIESVMLVGHNPGLEGLLKILTDEVQPMPTAALAVIDLKIGKWSEINSSTGNLRTLIRPKEIK
jgi:phosphohistidine phosphatase